MGVDGEAGALHAEHVDAGGGFDADAGVVCECGHGGVFFEMVVVI